MAARAVITSKQFHFEQRERARLMSSSHASFHLQADVPTPTPDCIITAHFDLSHVRSRRHTNLTCDTNCHSYHTIKILAVKRDTDTWPSYNKDTGSETRHRHLNYTIRMTNVATSEKPATNYKAIRCHSTAKTLTFTYKYKRYCNASDSTYKVYRNASDSTDKVYRNASESTHKDYWNASDSTYKLYCSVSDSKDKTVCNHNSLTGILTNTQAKTTDISLTFRDIYNHSYKNKWKLI